MNRKLFEHIISFVVAWILLVTISIKNLSLIYRLYFKSHLFYLGSNLSITLIFILVSDVAGAAGPQAE